MFNLSPVEKISAFINLGNRAKDIKWYALSNACFVQILSLLSDVTDEINDTVFLTVESQEWGYDHNQAYYDLALVATRDESLCIPVPLLSKNAAFSFMKVATLVYREEHKRETEWGVAADYQQLLDEFVLLSLKWDYPCYLSWWTELDVIEPPEDEKNQWERFLRLLPQVPEVIYDRGTTYHEIHNYKIYKYEGSTFPSCLDLTKNKLVSVVE
ncbi:hypothetical protein [Scytonema sp. NUACC26]|uniref:hypothetical protein n=1 Tax=Scytonema sp. NUACC26 TaxID=3140176 RepID=UPI0034DC5987